jgi:hypothetical protein
MDTWVDFYNRIQCGGSGSSPTFWFSCGGAPGIWLCLSGALGGRSDRPGGKCLQGVDVRLRVGVAGHCPLGGEPQGYRHQRLRYRVRVGAGVERPGRLPPSGGVGEQLALPAVGGAGGRLGPGVALGFSLFSVCRIGRCRALSCQRWWSGLWVSGEQHERSERPRGAPGHHLNHLCRTGAEVAVRQRKQPAGPTGVEAALVPSQPPDRDGCWTGCVVDVNGVATAIYTGVVALGNDQWTQTICLATGTDPGLRIWGKHPGNPLEVEPPGFPVTAFRDPYVWRDDSGWVILRGSSLPSGEGAVLCYRSGDLLRWSYEGVAISGGELPEGLWTGAVWECPVLIPVSADRHLLLFSVADPSKTPVLNHPVAVTGRFDGARFRPGIVSTTAMTATLPPWRPPSPGGSWPTDGRGNVGGRWLLVWLLLRLLDLTIGRHLTTRSGRASGRRANPPVAMRSTPKPGLESTTPATSTPPWRRSRTGAPSAPPTSQSTQWGPDCRAWTSTWRSFATWRAR